MSFNLAEGWVAGAFGELRSAIDALNLFEKASAEGVDATLMMVPELMNSGKCCLTSAGRAKSRVFWKMICSGHAAQKSARNRRFSHAQTLPGDGETGDCQLNGKLGVRFSPPISIK